MNVVIEYFMYYILPYITVIIFFGGFIYKIVSWIRTPAPNTALELYPKPEGTIKMSVALTADQTIFPSLFSNKILAIFGFGLHLSILMMALGHIRIFGEPQFLWNLLRLDEHGVHIFAYVLGGIAGMLFMISLIVLLGRRFFGIMKKVSVPIDFILLTFLIAIAISGNYMRFFDPLNMAEVQEYFSSLFVFKPKLTPVLYKAPFIVHNLITQAFIMYMPFSKLVHIVGSFITNWRVKRGDKH